MAEFTFGQVEAILALLNQIAVDKRAAFVSRLKHLQKNKLPLRDERPGRGKAASYSFQQVMHLAIGVELIQAGLSPKAAADLIIGNWGVLRLAVGTAAWGELQVERKRHAAGDPQQQEAAPEAPEANDEIKRMRESQLWLIWPMAMRDLTTHGTNIPQKAYDLVQQMPKSDLSVLFGKGDAEHPHLPPRVLIIEGTRVALGVIRTICYHYKYAKLEELNQDLDDEISGGLVGSVHLLDMTKVDGKTVLLSQRSEELGESFFRVISEWSKTRYHEDDPGIQMTSDNIVKNLSDVTKYYLWRLVVGAMDDDNPKYETPWRITRELLGYRILSGYDSIVLTRVGFAVLEHLKKSSSQELFFQSED